MSEVSCYAMTLYCDHPKHRVSYDYHRQIYVGAEEQYNGCTRSECTKQARMVGWIFHRNGKLTCPDCRNKK